MLKETDIRPPSNFPQVPPVKKRLACGDVGNGAMASVEDIVKNLKR